MPALGPDPVSVVVPTYREASNVRALAEGVHAVLSGTGIEWELILADDDSADGTEALVDELARCFPIRLETRREPPRDLSRSVLFGIARARHERVVVMDADLSHPPARIPDLLRALDEGCDMAVGSRYAPGGRIDGGWSRWRLLGSRAATSLARPLVRCSDPMSGFFAADRRVLPGFSAMTHVRTGWVLAGLERHEEAVESFRDALALEPESVMAHASMGDALVRLERYEEALESFERALSADPPFEPARAGAEHARRRLEDSGR